MKTKLLLLLLLANFSIYAQYTSIPDPKFEAKLIKLNIDSGTPDGQVLTSRIASITSLDVSSSSITDLTGIQDFVRLITLDCSSNQLVNLNVTKNTVLTTLNCNRNKLTALNVDKNVALTSLTCEENQIKSLDVSNSTSLTNLSCKENLITSLDLSKNLALLQVISSYNKLTSLNVSQNAKLTKLEIERNQLTSLDLNSPNLKILSCAYNKITTLDVSKCPKLTEFSCNDNNLTYLNLHNKNNTLLTYVDFTTNPDLDCILVDFWYYSNANWPTKKDDTANYVPFCGVKYTLIPDLNFEKKLVSLGLDDEANGAVLTEKIAKVQRLTVSELHIQDLTGIEDFKALIFLNCAHNQITNLDVSQNVLLSYLNCGYNYLTSLDISKNTVLSDFDCYSNRLTALDVSKNLELHYIDCGSNKIVILDISKNYDLRKLSCGLNKLLSLNLKNGNNGASFGLSYAYMRDNPDLTCIQIDEKSKGYEFNLQSDPGAKYSSNCPSYTLIPDSNFENKLIELKIDTDGKNGIVATSSIAGITSLDVSSSSIADLTGIQDFVALKNLNCSSNELTTLDLSKHLNLTSFKGNNNKFINLNLKNGKNTFLTTVDFTSNPTLSCIQVDDIDYSKANWTNKKDATANFNTDCTPYTLIPDPKFEQQLIDMGIDKDGKNGKVVTARIATIKNLYMPSASITDLTGIQDFTSLEYLSFPSNQVKTLDVSKNLLLFSLDCSKNKLSSLDLSKNTALLTIDCRLNSLLSLNLKNGKSISLKNDIYSSFLNNPDLKCIQVDDEAFFNQNWADKKDASAIYSSTCKQLGLEENVFDKVAIYPNPTKGELNILNLNLEKANVYNTLGQLVKSFTLNSANANNTINLSGLPKGVYYVYLINEDAASAKKIIIE